MFDDHANRGEGGHWRIFRFPCPGQGASVFIPEYRWADQGSWNRTIPRFSFEVRVSDIESLFPGEERTNFDLFLGIQRPAEEVTEDLLEGKQDQAVFYPRADGGQDICYPIRLGRFAEMDYKEFVPYQTEEGLSSYLYVTKKEMYRLYSGEWWT